MAWSRLRKQWRHLLAPSVARRVDAHMTGYRKAYERRGRAWLTVDGVTVASFCEFVFENAWREEGRREGATGWSVFTNTAHESVRAKGLLDKTDLLVAIGACVHGSADGLLASPDPLGRALAVLDRRIGKRRLAKIDVSHEHPLVVQLHRLRCESEGMRVNQGNEDVTQ